MLRFLTPLTVFLNNYMVFKNFQLLLKSYSRGIALLLIFWIYFISFMGKEREIRFWKISGIRMTWSLEAWMNYRENSFRICFGICFGVLKFVSIMYNAYHMLLLILKFFQVCEICATPCCIWLFYIDVNIGTVKN